MAALRIAGWASLPVIDCAGDRIHATGIQHAALDGSFKAPTLLWAHDGRRFPVGVITEIEAKAVPGYEGVKGLWFEAEVINDDLAAILQRQKLAISIGVYYITADIEPHPKGQQYGDILDVKASFVDEITICRRGCCPGAGITEVGKPDAVKKAADKLAELKELLK